VDRSSPLGHDTVPRRCGLGETQRNAMEMPEESVGMSHGTLRCWRSSRVLLRADEDVGPRAAARSSERDRDRERRRTARTAVTLELRAVTSALGIAAKGYRNATSWNLVSKFAKGPMRPLVESLCQRNTRASALEQSVVQRAAANAPRRLRSARSRSLPCFWNTSGMRTITVHHCDANCVGATAPPFATDPLVPSHAMAQSGPGPALASW